MPLVYQRAIRNSLSKKYRSKAEAREDINKMISIILDEITIKSSEEKSSQNKDGIDMNMMILLNLINFAKDYNVVDEWMNEVISSRAIEYASKKLFAVEYEEVNGSLYHFLTAIPNRFGYSLNDILSKFLKNREISDAEVMDIYVNLSGRFDSAIRDEEALKLLMSLNNLFVVCKNEKFKKNILDKIESELEKLEGEYKATRIIEENIDRVEKNQKNLFLFPQIAFHRVSQEGREKAERWVRKNAKIDKIANLSNWNLKDGLGVLVHFLLENKCVEEVDLSHNSLGWDDWNPEAVRELLEYPGTLKILKLNNNSLCNSRGARLILDGLGNNTTLEEIALNNNSMGDQGIEMLCNALENHKSIKRIKLHYNKFTDVGLKRLKKLMEKNPNIDSITTEYSSWWWQHHDGTKEIVRQANGQVKCIY